MLRSHPFTSAVGACLFAWTALACAEQVTAPEGQVMLQALQFTQAEIEAGEPLILVARGEQALAVTEQPFLVRTSSGIRQQRSLTPQAATAPWDALSDEELAAVIGHYDGIVMIRFKEAGADWGVDDQGQNVTSDQTVDRMKDWVRQQGVTITSEWVLQPGVTGTMPTEPALVGRLRGHENVDLVEPGGVEGEFLTGAGTPLISVILTAGETAPLFTVRPGDEVVAEYRQPDGSVLRANTVVR